MIGIRADANETVATGHIMRCITIAEQLKKMGEGVLFFTADSYALSMLDGAGMECVCLNTKWDSMEEELPVLLEELKNTGCSKLLVDSYQVTPAYLEKLRGQVKVIYIDDMFSHIYPADMIINYNAYYSIFPYRESYKTDTRLLLGTSYVPLREEFFGAKGKQKADGKNRKGYKEVLLCCGGGDAYNALNGILSAAMEAEEWKQEFQNVIFHTIVGNFNPNGSRLKQLAGKYSNIKLHVNVKNMAELMEQCDAAVSAAGTVLFELSAMQVPAVFFVCADNQKYDREFFERENRMLFAGDIRTDREACIEAVCGKLRELLLNETLRQEMKIKLGEVTDGNGANRIAQEVLGI